MAMASRPIRPRNQQPTRTQSQNFQPQSDWRDEENTTILLVYLPGFVKEQVRTTYDASGRSIRLYGERRLPNNRRIRIDERYSVPENCEGSKMETQFGRGILMITFPKIKPAPMPVSEAEPESEPFPKIQPALISEPVPEPEVAPKPEETVNGVKAQKVEEEIVSVGKQTDGGKSVEGSGPENERSKLNALFRADGEETSPKTTLSAQVAEQEQHERPAQTESANLGHEEPKITDMVHGEEEERKEVIKEPAILEMAAPRAGEEEKEKITEEGGNHSTDSRRGDDVEERKAMEKIIPGLKMELNDPGNPLTNTVVAALVIMGIGACFFYSFGT